MARRSPLRPAGFDELGLKRAIGDRLLPTLVGAMVFLAALALAGAAAASALAQHWRGGAASVLTAQVPRPRDAAEGGTRLDRALLLLRGTPGVASARPLDDEELAGLLRPWLGSASAGATALPLPGVIEVRLADGTLESATLATRLGEAVPGAILESQGAWAAQLAVLARSLQACAALAVLVVAGVSAAVVMVATRAGLATRRDAIEIVHTLGATDGYIAGRFAWRAMRLAAAGGLAGTVAALPVLVGLAYLAAPFASGSLAGSLPDGPWLFLPVLPIAAAAIGWATAQATVRRWLRRLP